jgi:cyclic pyranopterin phosphate synthase
VTPSEGTRRLTHVDETGAARMVDVGDKEVTRRVATASGVLRTTTEVCAALRDGTVPKGDALATARIAGIMGAKRTPDLVPLCHPIPLAGVTARSADRTGVEMEALTAVSVAGLALHDMIKALDPAATMDGVRLERKEGGRSGVWTRPADR